MRYQYMPSIFTAASKIVFRLDPPGQYFRCFGPFSLPRTQGAFSYELGEHRPEARVIYNSACGKLA